MFGDNEYAFIVEWAEINSSDNFEINCRRALIQFYMPAGSTDLDAFHKVVDIWGHEYSSHHTLISVKQKPI